MVEDGENGNGKGNPKWNQETLQMSVSGGGWFELEDVGDTQVAGAIGQRGCSSPPCGRGQ